MLLFPLFWLVSVIRIAKLATQEKKKLYRLEVFTNDSFQKVREMWTRMEAYREKRQPVTSQVINNDVRTLEHFPPNLRVQLVITSPPYPNAFDYFLYHRHRMFWLGYDPIVMSRKEIGSHLNYQRKGTTEQNIAAFKNAMLLCFSRDKQNFRYIPLLLLCSWRFPFQKTTCEK